MIKMRLEHFLTFLTQKYNWRTKLTAAVTNTNLRAWFFSSVLWAKGEELVFRKHLMKKYMDIPSVLFSILEAAWKRRLTATEAEIK